MYRFGPQVRFPVSLLKGGVGDPGSNSRGSALAAAGEEVHGSRRRGRVYGSSTRRCMATAGVAFRSGDMCDLGQQPVQAILGPSVAVAPTSG
jgi:hypothetical protein